MNVGNSVRKAIEDWEAGESEAAMMHACNAVDGTAAKLFPKKGVGPRFTQLLRDNYSILEPMGAPGIDLTESRFNVPGLKGSAPGGKPDIADVIYGVHRCCHGHGDELPAGFELIDDARGPAGLTHMGIAAGILQLSDRVIFGLLAVAILCPVNVGQQVPNGYRLIFGNAATLFINGWWGDAADFGEITNLEPVPRVRIAPFP